MTRSCATGITALLLGLGVVAYVNTIPNPDVLRTIAGPRIFPYITAGILIVCGLGLIFEKSQKEKPFLTKKQWINFVMICSVYLGYAILLWAFGFIIATILCLFTLSTMFSRGKPVPIWLRAIYAVGITAVLYICFFTLLGMSLPVGKFVRLII